MSYDVSIQPKDSGATAWRSSVEAFIVSIPGVRQENPGVFAYADERRRLHASIYTGEADTIGSVGVSVPAAFTGSSGEPALLLCFEIAEHLGWQVFDPQVGDFLAKGTAAEVLHSNRDYGDTAEEVLRRRSAGEASFAEIFAHQFARYSPWILIPTLVVAAFVAGYLVVQRGVAESRFPWIFFGIALGIHVLRALVCTIWPRIRHDKSEAPLPCGAAGYLPTGPSDGLAALAASRRIRPVRCSARYGLRRASEKFHRPCQVHGGGTL